MFDYKDDELKATIKKNKIDYFRINFEVSPKIS